jgi:HAD superfamily hydrolase (TIGR01509 family)
MRRDDIDGVFFDLYGTLLVYGDMDAAWSDWLSELHASFARRGHTVSREELARRCDRFFTKEWPPAPDRDDGLTLFERRIRHLASEMAIEVTDDDARHVAGSAAAAWQRHVTVDPDAREVLAMLARRRRLALVSNFDHPPLVYDLLEEHDLGRFFETIVISAEAGVRKPDPAIFDPALEATGLAAARVVYVGDSELDVLASKAAGITPIVIRRDRGDGRRAAADFRADPDAEERVDGPDPFEGLPIIASLGELIDRFEAGPGV